MSLKVFHVFFILVSILLSFGCAAWIYTGGAGETLTTTLHCMGAFCILSGLALVFYLVCFIRKARHIII